MPLRRLPVTEVTQANPGLLWSSETASLIEQGRVLPFISNYHLAQLFDAAPAEIALSWAEDMASPLTEQDNRDLARVAQFYGVKAKNRRTARVAYLRAIKRLLLAKAQEDPNSDHEYVDGLIEVPQRLESESFSKIARNLGYPHFGDPSRNAMRLLAELPLPIYVTTGQHMFLENALVQTGFKKPETEIFYWDDAQDGFLSIYEREPEYRPSVERPLVYHLFGVDERPESLVLSEDDYVDVLMRLSELKREVKLSDSGWGGVAGAKRDIPSDIKTALSGSGLLLLGYDITSWEFRVLVGWLVRYIRASREGRSAPDAFCMQLVPSDGANAPETNRDIQDYLTRFFEMKNFSVHWGDLESCVFELWSRWKQT